MISLVENGIFGILMEYSDMTKKKKKAKSMHLLGRVQKTIQHA